MSCRAILAGGAGTNSKLRTGLKIMPNSFSDTGQGAHAWYEENAAPFTNAKAIEQRFIGMDAESQERLNLFKLWALDRTAGIDFTGESVLDLGAGHARLALAFPKMSSYLGVDYSTNLISIGRRRLSEAGLAGHARLEHADCSTWRGAKESFDIVCSLGMLCYFSDPETMIRSMAYHLRPGGTLFFDFRSSSPLLDPIRKLLWKLRPPTSGSAYVWSPARTVAMLRAAGLGEIRIVMREFPLLGPWYANRRWDWPLKVRNAIAENPLFYLFATEAWAFAKKPLAG
jgi:SAM-dependent methyltransferase